MAALSGRAGAPGGHVPAGWGGGADVDNGGPPGAFSNIQPSREDIEYQKKVARQLIDALDDSSLWQLAGALQRRGLLQPTPAAAATVPWPVPAVPYVQGLPQMPPYSAPAAPVFNPGWPTPPPPTAAPAVQVARPYPQEIRLASALPEAAPTWPPPPPVAAAPSALPQALAMEAPAALAQADDRRGGGDSSSDGDGAAAAPQSRQGGTCPAGEASATSLILRNMPPTFDQLVAQQWVDEQGFMGLYDFLLWFPAKKTSRLSAASYAFVNFRGTEVARNFRRELHAYRFQGAEDETGTRQQWQLSIAAAKVQGFAENFVRFHHLVEGSSPTLCKPFFAEDTVAQLSTEHHEAAAAAALAVRAPDASVAGGGHTTVVIRNLPVSIAVQDAAKQWLDAAGFLDLYDFFVFLPPKRRRTDADGGPAGAAGGAAAMSGLGYAFVNFRAPRSAQLCVEQLSGRSLAPEDPRLNVIASRVQGLEECRKHFSSLAESGRIVPWAAPRQFQ